jgi:hypothetical protein
VVLEVLMTLIRKQIKPQDKENNFLYFLESMQNPEFLLGIY